MNKAAKLLRLIARPAYRRGLRNGVAAGVEHEPFLRTHRYATVLDAGANKGQFALAVRAHMPDVEIIAFEPLAGPAATFRRLFRFDPKATLIEKALGPSAGVRTIHLSNRLDSSSLLPIGRQQSQAFPGTHEISTATIAVTTLDQVCEVLGLKRPALLKIDVQGFELGLLQGAERTLATAVDDIYVELSYRELYESQPLARDVIEWLRQRGFQLEAAYHTAFGSDGDAIQSDMLFRRRS